MSPLVHYAVSYCYPPESGLWMLHPSRRRIRRGFFEASPRPRLPQRPIRLAASNRYLINQAMPLIGLYDHALPTYFVPPSPHLHLTATYTPAAQAGACGLSNESCSPWACFAACLKTPLLPLWCSQPFWPFLVSSLAGLYVSSHNSPFVIVWFFLFFISLFCPDIILLAAGLEASSVSVRRS